MISSFDDKGKRQKALVCGWLGGTLMGAAVSLTDASLATLAAVSLLTAFSVFLSMLRPTKSALMASHHRAQSRRNFAQFAYAPIATMMLVVIERLIRTPESVHAAAEQQYDAALSSSPASRPPEAKIRAVQLRVQQLLPRYPSQNQVRLDLVSDYAKLQAASIYNRSQLSPTNSPRATISYNVSVADSTKPLLGYVGAWVFLNMNFTTKVPGAKLLEVAPFARPIFKDCTIDDFSLDLGRIVWINVTFNKCILSYVGGPLLLVDVNAEQCTLHVGERVPAELADALKSAFVSSRPISITSALPA
jgi:hypothetical protein